MASDYIPQRIGQYDEFAENMATRIADEPAVFGVSPADATALANAYSFYVTLRSEYNLAKTNCDSAATASNDARDALTTVLRRIAQNIENREATTDTQRSLLKLPIHKDDRTPVPPPASEPVLEVIVKGGGRHELLFHDAATPHSDRKPAGVMGCEIHEWVGANAPTDYASWPLAGIDTHNPYTRQHPPEDAGKEVIYVGRWLNAKGEAGAWGPLTAPQTITR